MNFLKLLAVLLILALIAIGSGFYLVAHQQVALGHKVIGLSTLFIFLVLMPVFIWYRYKDKDLSKFNLQQDKKDDDQDEDWDIEDKSRWN
ncbi:hypothetical protein [Nonlabens xiamenensis]|uniref:hypothetical protein n=1 Tax=Nonlabens xiamenensis TaxID=2341043 RepID=UPI000F610F51|nr:hypothetical protein [Nonlabens xiamenensis]